MRTNLLEQILNRPAAQAVPHSPGEAVSRFRDDIQVISTFLSSAFNLVGVGVFVILALVTMMRINLLLTMVAFLPLLLINIRDPPRSPTDHSLSRGESSCHRSGDGAIG